MKATAVRPRLSWSDFHLVLELARHGHTVRAAGQLAMSHVTLLRKLAAIESRLGARLFDRERGRCTATAAGEELIEAAERMAPLAQQAETRVLGQDLRPSGLVRITAAGIVVGHLLPPLLAEFGRAYPEVTLELVATRQHLSLQRREADVALRIADRVPEWLVGRALATVDFSVYGLRQRGQRSGLRALPELLAQRRWISFEREARELKFDRWLDQHVPESSVVLRVDSFDHALAMVRAGLGIALLPGFLQRAYPELLPLSEPVAALRTPLWLITHRELRDTMRIRVVMQALGPALQRAVGGA